MKKKKTSAFLLLATFFAMSSAHAHDPSLHAKKAEKPNCEALKKTDQSTMATNDPIMMAMMKRCEGAKSDGKSSTEDAAANSSDDHGKKDADQYSRVHGQ